MSLLSALATIFTFIAWVCSMVLFGIARNHVRDNVPGATASYGNANWIAVAALASLLIGFCTAACGVFGSYHRRRNDY